jgi:hypothetical protein
VLQTQTAKPAVWPGWTLLLENGSTSTQSFAGFGVGGGLVDGDGDGDGLFGGVGEEVGLTIEAGLVLGLGGVELGFAVGLGFALAVGDGLVVPVALVLGLGLDDAAACGLVVTNDTTRGPAGRVAQALVAVRR